MRALVADPNPHSRTLLRDALQRRGWSVRQACSSADATDALAQERFALVVVGATLAGTDADLCHQVRASRAGRAAYLIALSGAVDAAATRRLAESGVDLFLARSPRPAEVDAALAFAEGHIFPVDRGPRAATRDTPFPQRIAALEEALRVQRASLEELFHSAPEGVIVVDQQDRVVRSNAEFTRMFGYTAEEALGRPVNELIVPDHLRDEGERLTEGVRQGDRITVDTVRRRSDGTLVEVSVLATPICLGGQTIGAYGIYRDIAERKIAERALQQSEARYRARSIELEEALQTRSRLYTAMNHELRTPLSAIMLHQELLLTGALGEVGPEQREALQHAHTAATHLLELVLDMLDLARLEAGRVQVQPVPMSPVELLHGLYATALPLLRRHGSELSLELDPGVGTVVTDPQRVRQIVLNLLSNAAKFGRGRPVRLRCAPGPDGDIWLEVVDQGVGIHPEELDRVFEEFVQVGGEQEEGTGLGLAISRRLAELLHGRLEAESQPGVGSTFRLVLPGGER